MGRTIGIVCSNQNRGAIGRSFSCRTWETASRERLCLFRNTQLRHCTPINQGSWPSNFLWGWWRKNFWILRSLWRSFQTQIRPQSVWKNKADTTQGKGRESYLSGILTTDLLLLWQSCKYTKRRYSMIALLAKHAFLSFLASVSNFLAFTRRHLSGVNYWFGEIHHDYFRSLHGHDLQRASCCEVELKKRDLPTSGLKRNLIIGYVKPELRPWSVLQTSPMILKEWKRFLRLSLSPEGPGGRKGCFVSLWCWPSLRLMAWDLAKNFNFRFRRP